MFEIRHLILLGVGGVISGREYLLLVDIHTAVEKLAVRKSTSQVILEDAEIVTVSY
jgi:hypothetical protein